MSAERRKRAHFREKRDKMCPNIAAGHWNMKNSVQEKRNFSDEVTAAIRRIARNRKGPHQRPSEGLMEMCRADRTTPGRQLAVARIYGVLAFCSRKADEREWRGTGVQVSCDAQTLVGPHRRPAMLAA